MEETTPTTLAAHQPVLQIDALERALAAERRLECLVRLAAGILPPHYDSTQPCYRPPSAWRAFARELSRAKRHLLRIRLPDEA